MKKEQKNEPLIEELTTKDEMNLVEYPLTLLSRRVPKGVKTIELTDWVTIQGEKKQLKWVLTGSDAYGLPVGGDQDIYMVIMQTWKEQGFKDKIIAIGSIYRMLKKMGLTTNIRSYKRFKQALDRLTGLYITAENAFWDKKGRCYLSKRGFRIFEEYQLLEKYSKTDDTLSLPFGYIRASEFFYQSIKGGYLKDLDFRFYLSLPTPLSKKLYRYLDKKRYLGDTFIMELYKFAKKMGLLIGGSDKYYPSKVKQVLNPALIELKNKGFLKSYAYQPASDGKNTNLVFSFNQLPAKKHSERLTDDPQIEYLTEQILEVCQDRHSLPFYQKIAQLLPESTIHRALSETKMYLRSGEVRKSPGALFTSLVKKYAQDLGVEL